MGYGILGSKQELLRKYEEKHFDLGLSYRYNAHNQFLQTTIAAGLIGLLIYLSVWWMIGKEAILKRKYLLLFILLHCLILSCTESFLENQHELVFFLFFIFLFYYHSAVGHSEERAIASQDSNKAGFN